METQNFKIGTKINESGDHVSALKDYLKSFGYLYSEEKDHQDKVYMADTSLLTSEGDHFDEATESALKAFQRFYNLKESGTLTEETIDLMNTPRCGNPDNHRLFDQQTGMVAYFVVQGNKWGKTNLTFAFQNYTDNLSKSEIVNAIRKAFESWSISCFLTFTETTGYADIIIKFAKGEHGDGSPFDGPNGTLAHGFFPPPNGGDLAGDIHFDSDETWSLNNPPTGYDLWSVALHEIGHALGLTHSNVVESVMYAYYSGVRRDLHPDDIAGISSIYGGRGAKTTLTDSATGQPAFANLNNVGYLAWTGTNNEHHLNVMQTLGTRIWFGKVTLEETSLSGPSITSMNGNLFLAWRGVGNNRLNIMSSTDGKIWKNKVTLNETSFSSPSIYSFNGKLFLAWTGTDNDRHVNIMQSADGSIWTKKMTLNETSIDGPSICHLGNNLLLSWAGTDATHKINIIAFNGINWFNKVTLGETSYRTPNINNVNGTLVLAWIGTDVQNRLNILRSSNGVNFSNKTILADTSYFAPNISYLNSQGLILWTGKDNASSLNIITI